MSEVLVLVDHADGAVAKPTLELLTAARSMGEPAAVVAGPAGTAATLADTLAAHGAVKIYVAESDEVAGFLVAPVVDALSAAVSTASPAAVLLASSRDNKEIAARLALRLGSGVLTDAVGVTAEGEATQSVFGGAVSVQSKVSSGVPVITVRANSFPVEQSAAAGEQVPLSFTVADASRGAAVLEHVVEEKGSRPNLADASVIVSGGRGVGSADNFAIIEKVADSLGAAVGASRAATDAGWVPHQMQVGQTGVTVSPQLYVAVGISGAIQHRAGMQTSKTIVAINKDPEAPIFELSDFGVVGDLFTVAPALADQLTARK